MDYSFEIDWDDYIKSKNDILKKQQRKVVPELSREDKERISRNYAIADIYWKSVLAERKAAINKSQKHLDDFRRGKIAGVLV